MRDHWRGSRPPSLLKAVFGLTDASISSITVRSQNASLELSPLTLTKAGAGHAGAIVQARKLGDELYAGVHSDEEILANKGPTVMTLSERFASRTPFQLFP